MNILYLTQIYSDMAGGPLVFYDLTNAMSDRGHKVHVICNFSSTDINQRNIQLHIVKPQLKESYQLPPSILQNLRYIANCILKGISILDDDKIDIIHANSFTPIIAGNILGRLSGIPVLSTIFDVFNVNEFGGWYAWVRSNKLPRFYGTLGRIFERISLMMASDVIHTISNTTKQDILKVKPQANIKVIYPGIDTSVYNARTQTEYSDFVLFIGRLVFYKNVDILLRAFRYVLQKIPHAQLVIVGDGPMKTTWISAAINANIHKNIFFLGSVSTSDKIDLLRKCSVLALPSLFEGFGLVILEAFAMAKPVLASNIKPFDEIIEDGRDGYLLPTDDPFQWAERIQYLLMNKAACKTMGECGLPKAYHRFSSKKSMDLIEHLYEETSQVNNSILYRKRYSNLVENNERR